MDEDDDATEKAEADNYSTLDDLYVKGDELQKLSVIQTIPQLVEIENKALFKRIIMRIQQELSSASAEFHIEASKMFRLLIEMNAPVPLLASVLQGIEYRDHLISSSWMETLLAVIPNLPEDVIKQDVLKFAISKSQISQTPYFRVASCKMLGQISIHPLMTPYEVRKDVIPLVQSLCQDCFYEVRAAMCKELPNVAQGLTRDNTPSSVIQSTLLPVIVELCNDESHVVRCAAIHCVANVVSYFDTDTNQNTIVPLVRQLCIFSVHNGGDMLCVALSKMFGELVTNLEPHMNATDCEWYLEFYGNLSKRGLTTSPDDLDTDPAMGVCCRERCAYNLPALTLLVVKRIPSSINRWYTIFRNLTSDNCYIVRKTMAGCIHEVSKVLGDHNRLLKADFIKLLRDESEVVLGSIVPNIRTMLLMFVTSKVLTRDAANQSCIEFTRGLLKCQAVVFKTASWRLKKTYLEQLECLPACLPGDIIHQYFSPLVLSVTTDTRARPVRTQAARTLLIFLRYNNKENQKKWIRENLITNLCKSSSCYTRHIFVNMCAAALDIFSWKYFKEQFYLHLLTLADDPVSTIRYCVVNMIPRLKHILVLPLDRQLQIRLENTLDKMETIETDKDVLHALRAKLVEMRNNTQFNKQMELLEERRRIEEEEKIVAGRFTSVFEVEGQVQTRTLNVAPPMIPITARSRSATNVRFPVSSNDVSFLGKHFYVDAGISLSLSKSASALDYTKSSTEDFEYAIKAKEQLLNLKTDKAVGNSNSIGCLDKEVETSIKLTAPSNNLTDDMKIRLQGKSQMQDFNVKKRDKRYSCIFSSERKENTVDLRRRSLNISINDSSRIPKPKFCSKSRNPNNEVVTQKNEENFPKYQSNIDTTDKSRLNSAQKQSKKEVRKVLITSPKNEEINCKNETDANINSFKKVPKPTKLSNLPVMVKTSLRSQSERRSPR